MMTKLLLVLLIGLTLESIGVVLLNKGIKQIETPATITLKGVAGLLRNGVTNRNILVGVAFEAAFFGCLLYLMGHGDVSFIWPLTSLGFVITTLAAKWWLGEEVTALRWAGVVLIVLGAGVITFTEKQKEKSRAGAAGLSSP
ncbi:MAG: hypothetical protein JWN25_1673 [Verrucomicrobiales bacterium]|nr:hypothetical protein [Verrucomicrobiales bacterium]